MSLPKRYRPNTAEPTLQSSWEEARIYHFQPDAHEPVYSIDTPPPTVSGHLHLGHVYSYSHADFFARFWRMNGRNVFYPMGFDDNGLPTERLVERALGVRAEEIGRQAFIEKCLAVSEDAEADYEQLWRRLGLSIDWRYTYRTIDDRSRRISQLSFLELHEQDLAYRRKAPAIWCPECQTAIAQAELKDLERPTRFYTLQFRLENGDALPIATTRPELLPACVAVFVHPDDPRYAGLVGRQVTVPLFGQSVPLLTDPGAEREKGTGAVMCCTFGDTADVAWWHTHDLPLVEAIDRRGTMTTAAGRFAGQTTTEARRAIVAELEEKDVLLAAEPLHQSVRVHERCDTPVEYLVTWQWFVRVLPHKQTFLDAGGAIEWHPPHMGTRYRQWVENLGWDWCITRQRYFGVPFPIWYCADCGETLAAGKDQLPVDPTTTPPPHPCPGCGSSDFLPERDVMDTWATSSLSPQIVGQWLQDAGLYEQVFPFALRPQSHEIIRTWTFYTIVKSYYHFGKLPWRNVAISGWGLAPEGTEKLSKSRGGSAIPPLEMIENYSADAVRYWAASTGLGKDATINEERIQAGEKLVNKLYNVARFAGRFLEENAPPATPPALSPADRWLLSALHNLIARVTRLYQDYDYATAKSEIELFFWRDLADNYLEMSKKRLYEGDAGSAGARYTLYHSLLSTIKLLAPLLPHVTEQIYRGLFAITDGAASLHRAAWPVAPDAWADEAALALGESLLRVATAVRRYKSENSLSLGTEVEALYLTTTDQALRQALAAAEADLLSITRARQLIVDGSIPGTAEPIEETELLRIGLAV